MEYKRFTVKAFEREPGKWRASIQRTNGKPLWAGRAKIRHFVTGIDATTPQRAMQMALAAIDRGAFSSEPVGFADIRCDRGRQARVMPDLMRRRARMGGYARKEKLSAKRLSEIGRNAANASWQRHRESKKQARNKNEAVIHEVMRRSLAPAPKALLFPQRPG